MEDPNRLWERFVSNPVKSLSVAQMRSESDECNRRLAELEVMAGGFVNTWIDQAIEWGGRASLVGGFPLLAFQPAAALAIWGLGAGTLLAGNWRKDRAARQLETIDLLADMYRDRLEEIMDELLERLHRPPSSS